jgi:hypothetical protein
MLSTLSFKLNTLGHEKLWKDIIVFQIDKYESSAIYNNLFKFNEITAGNKIFIYTLWQFLLSHSAYEMYMLQPKTFTLQVPEPYHIDKPNLEVIA